MLKTPPADAAELTAPLNSFFVDDFLTLLYLCEPEHISQIGSDDDLPHVKSLLSQVSDRSYAKHQRAAAAVDIGRFVRKREKKPGKDWPFTKRQRSISWFQLARELGSVVGATELANTLLARGEHDMEFDVTTDMLPRLYNREGGRRNTEDIKNAVVSEAANAWKGGVGAAYRHLQRRFEDWESEEFRCALTCIVAFLTLPRLSHLDSRVDLRRQALRWINPVWNALIDVAPAELCTPYKQTEEIRALLIEQRLAVLHNLYDRPHVDAAERIWVRLSDFTVKWSLDSPALQVDDALDASPSDANQYVAVLKDAIPASGDKFEQEILKLYASLQQRLSLTPLPALGELYGIESKLLEEFPWAQDAISTILSDLLARRRSGSVRLGLGTFLLVGPPGSGKTRFAMRLSSLLGSPNSVLNLAGMSDTKLIKGCTRGWAGARPSKIVEFIQQTGSANPFFVLDEIDKLGRIGLSEDPQAALLDLLEPGNARRYMDIFLMAECDLSHCMYIATANSFQGISRPLLSRVQPVFFPKPEEEHAPALINGVLRDFESSWGLPAGALTLSAAQAQMLLGLSPREMRAAIPKMLGRSANLEQFRRH
jgi:hypothetical protein